MASIEEELDSALLAVAILKAENDRLKAENDRLKADLEIIRDWCDRATHRATEALKGGE